MMGVTLSANNSQGIIVTLLLIATSIITLIIANAITNKSYSLRSRNCIR